LCPRPVRGHHRLFTDDFLCIFVCQMTVSSFKTKEPPEAVLSRLHARAFTAYPLP
jgi:hypothetical protein